MGARDGTERRRILQTRECHELGEIAFIEALGFLIGVVGEPFHLGRNIRKITVLVRRECSYAIYTG